MLVALAPKAPSRESGEFQPFQRSELFLEMPLLDRDLLFRRRAHIIREAMARTPIPTVTPIIIGAFEVDVEDKLDAEIEVTDELKDADDDDDDGDGV